MADASREKEARAARTNVALRAEIQEMARIGALEYSDGAVQARGATAHERAADAARREVYKKMS